MVTFTQWQQQLQLQIAAVIHTIVVMAILHDEATFTSNSYNICAQSEISHWSAAPQPKYSLCIIITIMGVNFCPTDL